MKALVIIPTFNEAENIEVIIDRVLQEDESLHVLVIDDNSPDGTGELVTVLQEKLSRLHVIRRSGKLGLGSAYLEGFKYALKNGYDFIIEMDGDFSHNPDDLPVMLKEIQEQDIVVGSRYVLGVSVVYWPFKRLILSYLASLYVRKITGMKIKDPTAGFICYRRKVLEDIDLDKVMSDGYSFQIEIKYRAWLKRFRIKEIPIIFTDRMIGHSKMSRKIVYEAVWMVWKLKFLAIIGKL
jgi:dolichol-phosphate mannosyltransferase